MHTIDFESLMKEDLARNKNMLKSYLSNAIKKYSKEKDVKMFLTIIAKAIDSYNLRVDMENQKIHNKKVKESKKKYAKQMREFEKGWEPYLKKRCNQLKK